MASQRTFRLDDELDAQLVKAAKEQGRSVSNLIVWALVRELGDFERTTMQIDKVLKDRPDTAALKRYLDENPSHLLAPLPEGTPLPKIAPRKPR